MSSRVEYPFYTIPVGNEFQNRFLIIVVGAALILSAGYEETSSDDLHELVCYIIVTVESVTRWYETINGME
jgi:hypothetical protein